MNQSIRVQEAEKSKRLLALLIDIVSVAVSTLALFFILLYGVFGPIYHYNDKVNHIKQENETYGLTLDSKQSYDKYEKVLQDFYFEYFTDEIINTINTNYVYETYSSITHIYNVFVLNLPYQPEPTGDKYKGDLFQYKLDENGNVLVDEIGEKRPDKTGYNYEKYLDDLMWSKYNKLDGFLYDYKADYKEAVVYKNNLELTSRTIAIGVSVIAFAIIIPLALKNGRTLGNKVYDIAVVKNKGGFKVKPYHTIFRALALYTLPLIGVAIYDKYSLIAMTIFPVFISVMLMLFRSSGRDLQDLLSGTIAVDYKNSLIFRSAGEASLYEKKPENQIVEDKDYLEKLKATESVELETSRDEQFKNKNK